MRFRGEQLSFVMSDAYDRYVPQSHFLRKVNAAFDFSFIDEMCAHKYKSQHGGPGRPAEPPQRMFRQLLLMFLYQIKFERELERRVNDSFAFRWFCGYGLDEPVSSHKTMWAFRKRIGIDLFDEIFARLIHKCIERDLVNKKRWHVDATKQDAAATTFSQWEVAVILTKAMMERLSSMQNVEHNANGEPPAEMDTEMKMLVAKAAVNVSKLKNVSAARVLAKAEGRVYEPDADEVAPPDDDSEPDVERDDAQIKHLEATARAIWSKHPHAKGDVDARIGKTSMSKSFCGYLSTAVVDEKYGIILGCEAVAGNVDQAKTFMPAYNKSKQLAGSPAELAADRAFDILDIREKLESDNVVAYIPMVRSHRKGNVIGSEHFRVTAVGDNFEVICPGGHLMKQVKCGGDGLRVYRGTACHGCSLSSKCTTAKDGVRAFEFRQRLRKFQEQHFEQKKTAEYKHALKRRMSTIEPIFGHGKTFHNLGKCIYRSLPMNKIHSIMSFFAINLEKLVRYAPQGT